MVERQLDAAAVEAALAEFKDPETGRGALQLEQIRDVTVAGDEISLTLALTTHSAPLWEDVHKEMEGQLRASFPEVSSVLIRRELLERPPQKAGEIGLTAKSVIAVGSGKGGVGKSTIAVALAFGLRRAGCKVGLMDSDIYGPSIPHLLGLTGQPVVAEGKIRPVLKDGVPVMSMGFLAPPDQAVIWRGPMLHGAITQFLRDTEWGELDYLIVDMPPGTGDVALSLSQLLPVTGAVVVCTPQDVALLDAVKAMAMFRQVNIPVLGVVENMSGFVCPDTHKRYDIFGSGGAKQRAEQMQIPFLGEVPINIQVRVRGDEGRAETDLDDPTVAPYLEKICRQLARSVADAAAKEPLKPSLPILG